MMKSRILTLLIFSIFASFSLIFIQFVKAESQISNEKFPTSTTSNVNSSKFNFIADEYIVTFENNSVVNSFKETQGVDSLYERKISDNTYLIKSSNIQNAYVYMDEAEQNSNVVSIDPNYLRFLSYVPNDPAYSQSSDGKDYMWAWKQNRINMEQAWDNTNAKSPYPGVLIAVIDSGVDYRHEELKNMMWIGDDCKDINGNNIPGGCEHGYDFVDNDTIPLPPEISEVSMPITHGTMMAGVISAERDNAKGLAGISINSRIMAVRVLDTNGSTSSERLIKAAQFAYENNARIVNLSLGGDGLSQGEKNIFAKLNDKGVIIVSAAGNDGTDNDNESTPEYPCNYKLSNSICVAATSSEDKLLTSSNYGKVHVEVAAPGSDIIMPAFVNNKSEYYTGSGTSISTAFVSGEAALVWGYNPDLSASQVRENIITSGNSLSETNKTITDKRINVNNAILKAQAVTPTATPTTGVLPSNTPIPNSPTPTKVPNTSTPTPSPTLITTPTTPLLEPNTWYFLIKGVCPDGGSTKYPLRLASIQSDKYSSWDSWNYEPTITSEGKLVNLGVRVAKTTGEFAYMALLPGAVGNAWKDKSFEPYNVAPSSDSSKFTFTKFDKEASTTNTWVLKWKQSELSDDYIYTIKYVLTADMCNYVQATSTPEPTIQGIACGPMDVYNKQSQAIPDQFIDINDYLAFRKTYLKTCSDDQTSYLPCGGKNRRFDADDHKVDISDFIVFRQAYLKPVCTDRGVGSLPETGETKNDTAKYVLILTLEVLAAGVVIFEIYNYKKHKRS